MKARSSVCVGIIAPLALLQLCAAGGEHLHAQQRDSIYYRNFVYHADNSACRHKPPTSSFAVYLNRDDARVLFDSAPRWNTTGDPNIDGKGTFGIELANFALPPLQVGDSVFIRFTCDSTSQQNVLRDRVTGIPWQYFPKSLKLAAVTLPPTPSDLGLVRDTLHAGRLRLTWSGGAGCSFIVYRRVAEDTVFADVPRMMYARVADNVLGTTFVDSNAAEGRHYGYVVCARSAEGIVGAPSAEVNDLPVISPGTDLTVGYLARLPRLNYMWNSSDPSRQGWPASGEIVTWQAAVKNWSATAVAGVVCRWDLDGMTVERDTVTVPALDTAGVTYRWPWTFARHELGFVLDETNVLAEEEEGNNTLSVFTDAIGAGLYVEEGVYDYFRQYQKELNVHSNCWEDWAQRQVRRWNAMFAAAAYPESPGGVADRIRLDAITVVPDGALPLAGGGYPTNMPNLNDRTVDLQWGFVTSQLGSGFYGNHTSASDNNPFYYEGSLIHELGHARYLIDVYGFNVHDNGTGNVVAVREGGNLIVGTAYFPSADRRNYYTTVHGLMNGEYTYVDRYSAAAMNLIAGHRAVLGNYNAPGNIGVFMNDLPLQNRFTFRDQDGLLLPGAQVKVFQATGKAGDWYGKYFDNTSDLEVTADSLGRALLGRNPFRSSGDIVHGYGESNGVILLRVEHDGRVGYAFFESMWLNLRYWTGSTVLADYDIALTMISPTEAPEVASALPGRTVLLPNYPNPFNPSTTVTAELAAPGELRLSVHDPLGREVAVLADGRRAAGRYTLTFDGSRFASGVYFVRMQAGAFCDVRRMMLVK